MWLIIGYGNRLRGDDGAGPLLAEHLAAQLPADTARVLIEHQLTPELVEELIRPQINQVLFIDVRCLQSEALQIIPLDPQEASSSSAGHLLQPELLLYTAVELYQRHLPGWLLTLPGTDFNFSENLSHTTAAAVQQAALQVPRLLQQLQAHE